jgi:hypothetical protein
VKLSEGIYLLLAVISVLIKTFILYHKFDAILRFGNFYFDSSSYTAVSQISSYAFRNILKKKSVDFTKLPEVSTAQKQ